MLTNFIYKNPPDSGLGDRLLDIFTLYAYSRFLKYENFYLYWSEENITERQCLKRENLFNYIEFPKNIHFVSKKQIDFLCSDNNNYVFNDALGATSLFLFQDKYIKNKNDFDVFKNIYYESFNLIKFINIPDYVRNIFENNKNITTIHLRRTDKVNNTPDAHGVDNKELNFLNNKTVSFIEQKIKEDNIICFISDENIVKNNYINLFKNIPGARILGFNFQDNTIQTFIDYYCLVHSKIIFMSQKFSTFSITSSLIKNNTLYYCFDYGRIFEYDNIKYRFNEYPNFIMF